MSSPNIGTYMKTHYQLVVIASLSIAIKVDSPDKAPSSKYLSELCMGAYTPEEIQSEEMCVIKTLSWRLNPPIASQMANHVLTLVLNSVDVGNGRVTIRVANGWESFVQRVHAVINTSVLDQGLTTLRPSTLALASILVSTDFTFCDPVERHGVFRSTLSIVNMFDFGSPCEVDSVRNNLSYFEAHDRSQWQQTQPQFQEDQTIRSQAIIDSERPNHVADVVPFPRSRLTPQYQVAANQASDGRAGGEENPNG